MCGAIPPLPIMRSFRGAQLKHKNIFTLTFNTWTWVVSYNIGERS